MVIFTFFFLYTASEFDAVANFSHESYGATLPYYGTGQRKLHVYIKLIVILISGGSWPDCLQLNANSQFQFWYYLTSPITLNGTL